MSFTPLRIVRKEIFAMPEYRQCQLLCQYAENAGPVRILFREENKNPSGEEVALRT